MESIFLRLRGKENVAFHDLPKGFWESPQEVRRDYILQRWSDVECAANGRGGVWAITIWFKGETK